jgi:hypothetical protein
MEGISMRTIIYLTLICLSTLFIGCNSNGTEYFLSSSGDDSAIGTSPELAWKSIDKVNSMTFEPGDKILFEGGKTFVGSLNFNIVDSGTPDNPVTVGSYGAGRATISSGNKYGLYAKNTSGFVVKDLIFIGAGADVDATFSGIYFFTDLDTVKPEYIRIDNVDVSGYRWDGIGIYGDKQDSSGFKDVRITNADVHDNGDKGISAAGPQPAGGWGHKNIYVGDCRVYNTRGISGKRGHSGNGIILSSVDGGMIEYCTANNNGEFSDDPKSGGPIGIWFWDTRNGIIQFCESYDNKTGNKADGGGFDLDGGCVNCIMQCNYSHGNHGAGYGIYQYTNAREFKDNIVRYNISENDGTNNKYGGINLWSTNSSGGIQKTKIYNNTITVSPTTRGVGIGEFPDEEGVSYIYGTEIYNNIIVSMAGKRLIDIPFPGDRWTFKGNCYWAYDGDIEISWGGTIYTSLQEWREATGQERLKGKDVGFQTDPELTNPGQVATVGDPRRLNTLNGYHLEQSSLLIDHGLDLKSLFGIDPGSRDFYGTSIPTGDNYDIGAHEFNLDSSHN